MASTAINTPPVVAETSCVVYDGQTGDVAHLHHIVTLEGGRRPSADEAQAQARELVLQLATTHRLPVSPPDRLKTLLVEPRELVDGAVYRVDLSTLRLVRVADPVAGQGADA